MAAEAIDGDSGRSADDITSETAVSCIKGTVRWRINNFVMFVSRKDASVVPGKPRTLEPYSATTKFQFVVQAPSAVQPSFTIKFIMERAPKDGVSMKIKAAIKTSDGSSMLASSPEINVCVTNKQPSHTLLTMSPEILSASIRARNETDDDDSVQLVFDYSYLRPTHKPTQYELQSMAERKAGRYLMRSARETAASLGAMFKAQSFYDVIIHCNSKHDKGEEPLYAHRVILQARSEAFMAMFNGKFTEKSNGIAEISTNVRRDVMKNMLMCMYTGQLCEPDTMTIKMFASLVIACNEYIVDDILRDCLECMTDRITNETIDIIRTVSELATEVSRAKFESASKRLAKAVADFTDRHKDSKVDA